jgi:hypothetical protein
MSRLAPNVPPTSRTGAIGSSIDTPPYTDMNGSQSAYHEASARYLLGAAKPA